MTRRYRDLGGEKFGRLTVIEFAGLYGKKQATWLCRCECGGEKTLRACSLTSGNVKSCGCLKRGEVPDGTGTVKKIRSNRIDHQGQRFGRLIVLSYAGHGRWNCRCDCGEGKVIHGGPLRSGDTRSCGCLEEENRIKHGLAHSPEYDTWVSMIQRCRNPKARGYPRYGGRGIDVCARWLGSFWEFFDDMGKRPSKLHSIDRHPDNDGNYSCGKCPMCLENGWAMNSRWATRSEQQRNKRTNHMLEHDGRTRTIAEWSEVTGLKVETISSRIRYGWSVERVLTESVHR